jgi:hypothetical protein
MKGLLFFAVLLLLLDGCKKEVGVQGPRGPQGPAGLAGRNNPDTGSISGTAFLFDEFSFRHPNQLGIAVTLISGASQWVGTTDSMGQFRFHGVPTGTYDLTYALAGFGTMKRFGISHFGGGNVPTTVDEVDLIQIPVKTAIDSATILSLYPDYVEDIITLDTSSLQYVQYYQNFLICIGKDAAVGPTDYVKQYDQVTGPDGNGNYVFLFSKSDVSSFFNAGDTLYISIGTYNRYLHPNSSALYLLDDAQNESYVDPADGYNIFPSARFSNKPLVTTF